MALRDYEVIRDKFERDETGRLNENYFFPCCACKHNKNGDADEPCRTCDHNANAKQD